MAEVFKSLKLCINPEQIKRHSAIAKRRNHLGALDFVIVQAVPIMDDIDDTLCVACWIFYDGCKGFFTDRILDRFKMTPCGCKSCSENRRDKSRGNVL